MKLLLLNENPVVGKLVTLSAQKTGDEVVSAGSVDSVEKGRYDLLIVDDGSYTEESLEALLQKVSVKQKLYMASRDAEVPEGFDKALNKPFLPTDLVELFSEAASSLPADEIMPEEEPDESDFVVDENFDEAGELADLESLDDFMLDEDAEDLETAAAGAAQTGAGDDELSLELDEDLADELSFDDELEGLEGFEAAGEEDAADELVLDDLDMDETESESVLDKEELEEVQSLLEEADVTDEDAIEVDELSDDEAPSTLNDATLDEVKDALEGLEDDFSEELDDMDEMDASDIAALEGLEDELPGTEEASDVESADDAEEEMLAMDGELALDDVLSDEELDMDALEDEAALDEGEEASAVEAPSEDALLDEALQESSSEEMEAEEELDDALTLDESEDAETQLSEETPEELDAMLDEVLDEAAEEEAMSDEALMMEAPAEEESEPEGEALDELDAMLEEVSEGAGDEEMAFDEALTLEEEPATEEAIETPEDIAELEALLDEEGTDETEAAFDEMLNEGGELDEMPSAEAMELEDLEQDEAVTPEEIEEQIQSAMRELSEEDLEQPVDEEMLLDLVNEEEGEAAFDGLDALDEHSLKVALGEADESEFAFEEDSQGEEPDKEELQLSVDSSSEFASLSAEALGEALDTDELLSDNPLDGVMDDVELSEETEAIEAASSQQGVEALQALLQALSNKEVAKSLKGMNININISFGDKD